MRNFAPIANANKVFVDFCSMAVPGFFEKVDANPIIYEVGRKIHIILDHVCHLEPMADIGFLQRRISRIAGKVRTLESIREKYFEPL